MMQTLGFPDHVFSAVIERDLVLFDSVADRYVALPGAIGGEPDGVAVAGERGLVLLPEAVDLLLGAALLVAGQAAGPVVRPAARPCRMLSEDAGRQPGARLSDAARIAVAISQANRRLERGLPCSGFTRTRRHRPIVSMDDLQEATRRMQAARLLVPHPRRCLPASIVAALFLRGLGQEVEIVFGVRSHPFEAHCWIEADGIVLDDELDRVRSYTPIAVGQL